MRGLAEVFVALHDCHLVSMDVLLSMEGKEFMKAIALDSQRTPWGWGLVETGGQPQRGECYLPEGETHLVPGVAVMTECLRLSAGLSSFPF